jgi:hypothetical protein
VAEQFNLPAISGRFAASLPPMPGASTLGISVAERGADAISAAWM